MHDASAITDLTGTDLARFVVMRQSRPPKRTGELLKLAARLIGTLPAPRTVTVVRDCSGDLARLRRHRRRSHRAGRLGQRLPGAAHRRDDRPGRRPRCPLRPDLHPRRHHRRRLRLRQDARQGRLTRQCRVRGIATPGPASQPTIPIPPRTRR